jgi:hypothetical protein
MGSFRIKRDRGYGGGYGSSRQVASSLIGSRSLCLPALVRCRYGWPAQDNMIYEADSEACLAVTGVTLVAIMVDVVALPPRVAGRRC